MRLLHFKDAAFSLIERVGINIPPYAILSHTWGDDEQEILYGDVLNGTGHEKQGWRKLDFCRQQAAQDGIEYFWVDTCCIDKSSSAELTEAINSMFRWYHCATACYVYLSDVSAVDNSKSDTPNQRTWQKEFKESRWFTRGW
jgi:hypothetical protein